MNVGAQRGLVVIGRRTLGLAATLTVVGAMLGGLAASAQTAGNAVTDAPQPPVADPPLYEWAQVANGPGFKGATVSGMANDASGNVVLVGAEWEQRPGLPGPYPTARAWHSPDGVSWTAVEVPDADGKAVQNVIHGPTGFLAADNGGLLTSPTGEEWTQVPGEGVFGEMGFAVSLVRTPAGYAAVGVVAQSSDAGAAASSRTPAAWTSADGITWQRTLIAEVEGSATAVVVSGDGSLLAEGLAKGEDGKFGPTFWLSADGGTTWSPVEVPTVDGSVRLAYAAGRFIVGYLASTEDSIAPNGWWSSADGVTWEELPAEVQSAEIIGSVGDTAVAVRGATIADNAHVLASTDLVAWTDATGGSLLGPSQYASALIGLVDGRLLLAGYDAAPKKRAAVLWTGTSDAVVVPSPSVVPGGSGVPGGSESPSTSPSPGASESPAAQSLEELAAIYVAARAKLTTASEKANKALAKVKSFAAEKKVWRDVAIAQRTFIAAFSELAWPADVTDELEPYLAILTDLADHEQAIADAKTRQELDRVYDDMQTLTPDIVARGTAFRAAIGVPE